MKIYIAYKFRGSDKSKLKNLLENVSNIIQDLNHQSFIFLRDIQKWSGKNLTPREIMSLAQRKMNECDVLLAIIESNEKSEGLLIESGFMKGLGKKIIVASKPNCNGDLLKGFADNFFEYKNIEDLREGIKKSLKKIDALRPNRESNPGPKRDRLMY